MEKNEKKYDFRNNTIYAQMTSLLYGRDYWHSESPRLDYSTEEMNKYYGLDTSGKIDAVEKALKKFLIHKLHWYAHYYEENLEDKNLVELLEIMSKLCKNDRDVWIIVDYVLGIISEFNGPKFVIRLSNDENLLDGPKIDYEKKYIEAFNGTEATEIFDLVMKNLFNQEYLESGSDSKKFLKDLDRNDLKTLAKKY